MFPKRERKHFSNQFEYLSSFTTLYYWAMQQILTEIALTCHSSYIPTECRPTEYIFTLQNEWRNAGIDVGCAINLVLLADPAFHAARQIVLFPPPAWRNKTRETGVFEHPLTTDDSMRSLSLHFPVDHILRPLLHDAPSPILLLHYSESTARITRSKCPPAGNNSPLEWENEGEEKMKFLCREAGGEEVWFACDDSVLDREENSRGPFFIFSGEAAKYYRISAKRNSSTFEINHFHWKILQDLEGKGRNSHD